MFWQIPNSGQHALGMFHREMPREELYGSHVKREYERKQLQISTEDCSLQLFQELNPVGKQSIVIWGNGSHINIKSFYRKKTYFGGKKNTEVISSEQGQRAFTEFLPYTNHWRMKEQRQLE